MKVGQLASQRRQLVQGVIKSHTTRSSVAVTKLVYLGEVLILTAVQVVMDLIRQVIHII